MQLYSVQVQYFSVSSVQFSCLDMSDSLQNMDCSTPVFPVHHQFLEFTQTHVHWVGDAIQLLKKWLIWKDPDAGKDWRQEEMGPTEDEMVWFIIPK